MFDFLGLISRGEVGEEDRKNHRSNSLVEAALDDNKCSEKNQRGSWVESLEFPQLARESHPLQEVPFKLSPKS